MCLPQLEYLESFLGKISVISEVEIKIRKKKKKWFSTLLEDFQQPN